MPPEKVLYRTTFRNNDMGDIISLSQDTLRILDANLNRTAEGLRVLEDIARLSLNNSSISFQLKTIRHKLVQTNPELQQELLWSRNSDDDVGRDTKVENEQSKELSTILIANARRVQESLRVLEELAKIAGMPSEVNSENFKQARFNLYSLEQQMLSQLLRQDKLKRLMGLYVIIDGQSLKGRSHIEVTGQVIRGGAGTIQLREKTLPKPDLLRIAREIRYICGENNVLFIVNDYLDVALDCHADGLHIGQTDLPVAVARKLLRPDQILGCSANTIQQAQKAKSEGADHIGVGAVFSTSSKDDIEVVGLDRLYEIVKAVSLPVVAIGGINKDNIAQVISNGAIASAVISAVVCAENPESAARELTTIIKEKK
jgi:thiamine-phosphate pyrophosphorylase